MARKALLYILALILLSCEKSSDKENVLLKFYGDAFEDIGYSISQADGGYFITGQFTQITREVTSNGKIITGSSKKPVVIKTNNDGNQVGDPEFPGGGLSGAGTKIITLEDGTAAATGFVVDTTTQKRDVYVALLSTDGRITTERIYKNAGNQYGTDIIKTPQGFIVLGITDVREDPLTESTGNAEGKKNILILRLRNNLDPLTSIPSVGYPGNDEGAAIKPDLLGGYLVVGTTDRSEKAGQAGTNIIMFRINSDGSLTDPRITGGTRNETAADFEVLSDGYLIAGTIGNEGSDQRGYIWKMPINIYNEPEFEYDIDIDPQTSTKTTYTVKAMCEYKTNSFLLAGQYGTGLSARMLIFSIDALGKPVEGKRLIVGGTGTQTANDVLSDENGYVLVTGRNTYENNSLITFMRFRF